MPEETSCKVCLMSTIFCLCPECPQCGNKGNPNCYKNHVLRLNAYQLVLRTEARIANMEEELNIERAFLQDLNEKPDSYCEDWSEI